MRRDYDDDGLDGKFSATPSSSSPSTPLPPSTNRTLPNPHPIIPFHTAPNQHNNPSHVVSPGSLRQNGDYALIDLVLVRAPPKPTNEQTAEVGCRDMLREMTIDVGGVGRERGGDHPLGPSARGDGMDVDRRGTEFRWEVHGVRFCSMGRLLHQAVR